MQAVSAWRATVAAVCAVFALLAGLAFAAEPPQDEELETVLVIGEQPGPGLWKVSKDGHVMWVLASYEPLPKGMSWRARQVEARIAESQQVLLPGVVDMHLDIGLFSALTHIPSIIKAVSIPDGKTLQDVLPPATYAKWRPLREKYVGRSVERLRPTLAIDELREAAYDKNDLRGGPDVEAVVRAAAKRHKVPVRRLRDAERTVRTPPLKGMLKTMQQVGLPDIDCFTLSLERVPGDLERMKVLANAWARGDIDAMRGLEQQPVIGNECENVLEFATTQGDSAGAAAVKQMEADWKWHEEQATVQAKREWVAAARGALERNRSTFAVLPVREVVGASGYLAELVKLGYEVEGP
jgi:hypothetical protein